MSIITPWNAVYFAFFWIMQTGAVVSFTYAGKMPNWRSVFLIVGYTLSMPSVYFLCKLYETMNVNVAYSIGVGAAFLFSQIALAVIFHSRLHVLQVCGILFIVVGILLVGLMKQ